MKSKKITIILGILIFLSCISLKYKNNSIEKIVTTNKPVQVENTEEEPFPTNEPTAEVPNIAYPDFNYDSENYDEYNSNFDEDGSSLNLPVDEKVGNYRVVLEDDADLINAENEKKLLEKMRKIAKYGNVMFKTININPYGSETTFASNYYHEKFGNGADGTFFLIDMQLRKIYIFSDGDVYEVITREKALTITDNTYRYATNANYYECAAEAFDEIYTLLEGGKINEPMKYIGNFFLSLVIAAILGFGIALKGAKIKKESPKDDIKKFNKTFTVNGPITAKKMGTKKVYSPVSDSSSGGGSSGGGGGGGSSGGGGGHSF